MGNAHKTPLKATVERRLRHAEGYGVPESPRPQDLLKREPGFGTTPASDAFDGGLSASWKIKVGAPAPIKTIAVPEDRRGKVTAQGQPALWRPKHQ